MQRESIDNGGIARHDDGFGREDAAAGREADPSVVPLLNLLDDCSGVKHAASALDDCREASKIFQRVKGPLPWIT
jgi:hypothetical protein